MRSDIDGYIASEGKKKIAIAKWNPRYKWPKRSKKLNKEERKRWIPIVSYRVSNATQQDRCKYGWKVLNKYMITKYKVKKENNNNGMYKNGLEYID